MQQNPMENGANMEQIGKRKIAKVFVYKALAIIVI